MPRIIGVRFNNAGKVYYFAPGELSMRYHDHVIVETSRGIEYGTVVIPPIDVGEEKVQGELKDVIRLATEDDEERERVNREKEKEACRICKQKIEEHGLDMKLIGAEYTFDNSKVLFYFTADGRIDFRELVKDLAGIFRTRIELRQIGVRDETKLLGGIGSCGRPLCCHTWLNEFAPVSIKMAKDQNLSLNPSKISGTCGRLMCCLKNEAETYAYLNQDLPSKGDYALAEDGRHGDVHSVNILRQTVKVICELENDEKELQEFEVKDLTFIPKAQKHKMREMGTLQEELIRKREAERPKKQRLENSGTEETDLPAAEAEVNAEGTHESAGEAPKKSRRQRNRRKPSAQGEATADAPAQSDHGNASRDARPPRAKDGREHADSKVQKGQKPDRGEAQKERQKADRGDSARDRKKPEKTESARERLKTDSAEAAHGQQKAGGADSASPQPKTDKPDAAKKRRRRRRPHKAAKENA
ncbi:MAG: hypothetical protein IJJ38_12400 [Lachnospiraceae bacterium]|nr:hypothetical protein [Lachnospiraceae bacterium]